MASNSHIEWTDATWNPVTGCTKISPGCKHCYAERLAKRLKALGVDLIDCSSGGAVPQDDVTSIILRYKG